MKIENPYKDKLLLRSKKYFGICFFKRYRIIQIQIQIQIHYISVSVTIYDKKIKYFYDEIN